MCGGLFCQTKWGHINILLITHADPYRKVEKPDLVYLGERSRVN
jgi:hypothetical protein